MPNINNIVAKDSAKYGVLNNKNNIAYYEVAIHTWLGLFEFYTNEVVSAEISNQLEFEGLIDVVKRFSQASEDIIFGSCSDSFVLWVCSNVQVDTVDRDRIVHQLLRYLKRFTPQTNAKPPIQSLLNYNNKAKMINRRGLSHHVIEKLRDVVAFIYEGRDISKWGGTARGAVPPLPNGAIFELSGKDVTPAAKQAVLDKEELALTQLKIPTLPSFGWDIHHGLGICSDPEVTMTYRHSHRYDESLGKITPVYDKFGEFVRIPCRYSSVPKKLGTRRNIAIAPIAVTTYAWHLQEFMYDALAHVGSDLHDQRPNMELARQGSIDGSVATIDMTAASDSVSWRLVHDVFPRPLFEALDKLRCTDLVYNKKNYLLHLFSTMGDRRTFGVESTIFLATGILACQLGHLYSEGEWLQPDEVLGRYQVRSYGDDLIVPDQFAETAMDILSILGFVPNLSKTCTGNTGYRESCGAEYLFGYDIASKYFPRREAPKKSVEWFEFLIDLQHKFFDIPAVNLVLVSKIREIYPDVTESYPNSIYSDIWSRWPRLVTKGDRTVHTFVQVHYPFNGDFPDEACRLAYYEALVREPQYADPICQIAGCTQPLRGIATYAAQAQRQIQNRSYCD